MKKLLFVGAAVLLLAAGCSSQTATNTGAGTNNTPTQNSADNNTPPAPTASNTTPPAPAAVDSSNASLNASLSNVDSQMNGLNSDSAATDQSINEQQAP